MNINLRLFLTVVTCSVGTLGCAGTQPQSNVVPHGDNREPTAETRTEANSMFALDCEISLNNSFASLDYLLDSGRSSYEKGYMDEQEFDEGRQLLAGVRDRLGLPNCELAEGEELAFYLCMSQPDADITRCGMEHNFIR